MDHRLSTIKLTAAERATATAGGKLTVRRAVEWPLTHRTPLLDQAYVDAGCTSIWGPGPYLKVPDPDPRDGERYIDRISCPWGYPPQRVRVMRSRLVLTIAEVSLAHSATESWEWVITFDISTT
jgi:hypothetical protein